MGERLGQSGLAYFESTNSVVRGQQAPQDRFGIDDGELHAALRVERRIQHARPAAQRLDRQARLEPDLATRNQRADLRHRAAGDDATLREYDYAIGERLGFLEVMSRQQDRAA